MVQCKNLTFSCVFFPKKSQPFQHIWLWNNDKVNIFIQNFCFWKVLIFHGGQIKKSVRMFQMINFYYFFVHFLVPAVIIFCTFQTKANRRHNRNVDLLSWSRHQNKIIHLPWTVRLGGSLISLWLHLTTSSVSNLSCACCVDCYAW